MLCDGNRQRKRQEMRLIFKLGTSQLRGLTYDEFVARSHLRTFLKYGIVAHSPMNINFNLTPTEEGLSPKRLDYYDYSVKVIPSK